MQLRSFLVGLMVLVGGIPVFASPKSDFHVGYPSDFNKALDMPRPLAVMIDDFIKTVEARKVPAAGDASVVSVLDQPSLERRHLELTVKMVESTDEVLSHPSIQVPLRRDGAIIDFKDWVQRKRGYFDLYLTLPEPLREGEPYKNLKVFYVSSANQRELREQKFGAGCSKFMDVSKFYKESLGSSSGLRLNSTDQRYLSVLAGTFYFFTTEADNYYLGSISFTDSRFPKLMCEAH